MVYIGWMQSDSHVRNVTLDTPASRRDERRSAGAERRACAPAGDWRCNPLVSSVNDYRPVVLAELEAGRRYRSTAGLACKPGWRYEADWRQPEPSEQREPPVDPLASSRLVQRQELSLARSLPQRAPAITPSARKPHLVVPLTVKKDLGTFRFPCDNPLDERGMLIQWPRAVPVRDDQQCREDAVIATYSP